MVAMIGSSFPHRQPANGIPGTRCVTSRLAGHSLWPCSDPKALSVPFFDDFLHPAALEKSCGAGPAIGSVLIGRLELRDERICRRRAFERTGPHAVCLPHVRHVALAVLEHLGRLLDQLAPVGGQRLDCSAISCSMASVQLWRKKEEVCTGKRSFRRGAMKIDFKSACSGLPTRLRRYCC